MNVLRIALLHIAPRIGNLDYNRKLVEAGVVMACGLDAAWVVTPELCLSGYEFNPVMGVDWMGPSPDPLVRHFAGLSRRLNVSLFLGHAEQDAKEGKRYNTVFVIGSNGEVLGKHHKRTVTPGIEAWSSKGANPRAIDVFGLKAGVLICADAYYPQLSAELKADGAQILISCANWTPKPHGPENSWEDRSRETGLPLFVCNRTGADHSLNFNDAESVVAKNGVRLASFSYPDSSLILLDWDLQAQSLLRTSTRRIEPEAPEWISYFSGSGEHYEPFSEFTRI